MSECYWRVGNKKFYNKFLAFQESSKTNQELYFYFYESLLDTISWNTSPLLTHTWNSVLLERALELRNKYDYIRLWFSGGHDSHLVFETFIRNNIFIDEIAVVGMLHTKSEHIDALNWLQTQKHRINPNTKIKTYLNSEKELKSYWGSENWFETLPGPNMQILPRQHGILSKVWPELTDVLMNGKTLCNISGLEKSRILIEDNKIYSCIPDVVFSSIWMGADNHEPFFISPNVWWFQTWYLIEYIKFDYGIPMNIPWINTDFQSSMIPQTYRRYCDANLRLPDINENTSSPNGKVPLALAPRYDNVHLLVRNHNPKIWKNFIHGLDYLQKHHCTYFNNNNVNNLIRGHLSKKYYVTEFFTK